jgi:hypothetical protein
MIYPKKKETNKQTTTTKLHCLRGGVRQKRRHGGARFRKTKSLPTEKIVTLPVEMSLLL